MADVNVPKWPPLTRDLDRRPRPDDYRSGTAARTRAFEQQMAENPAIDKVYAETERRNEMNAGTGVNLRKLQEFAQAPR